MSFQAYLDAVETKTGLTPRQLVEQATARGFGPDTKATPIVTWLADDYGLGRGHAMAIVHLITKGSDIGTKHVGTGTHRDAFATLWLDGKATNPAASCVHKNPPGTPATCQAGLRCGTHRQHRLGRHASMSVRRHRATATTLVAAAPLLLSACGGDDTSIADPPISSAPTSSAPPTTQRESAEHFIRRWAAEEKHMENTGEVATYLAMSKRCKACTKLADQVSAFYGAGGFVHWGGWRILRIQVNDQQSRSTTYAVRNRSLPTTYRESASSATKHLNGGVTVELLTVAPTATSWTLISKAELAS